MWMREKRNLNGKLDRMSFQPIRYSAICHGTQCDDNMLGVRYFPIQMTFLLDWNRTDSWCANKVFLHTQQMWSKKVRRGVQKKRKTIRDKKCPSEKTMLWDSEKSQLLFAQSICVNIFFSIYCTSQQPLVTSSDWLAFFSNSGCYLINFLSKYKIQTFYNQTGPCLLTIMHWCWDVTKRNL